MEVEKRNPRPVDLSHGDPLEQLKNGGFGAKSPLPRETFQNSSIKVQ